MNSKGSNDSIYIDPKIGDTVMLRLNRWPGVPGDFENARVGLVLGFANRGMVLVFWGEDFPCEEEYREQLVVI